MDKTSTFVQIIQKRSFLLKEGLHKICLLICFIDFQHFCLNYLNWKPTIPITEATWQISSMFMFFIDWRAPYWLSLCKKVYFIKCVASECLDQPVNLQSVQGLLWTLGNQKWTFSKKMVTVCVDKLFDLSPWGSWLTVIFTTSWFIKKTLDDG